MGRASARRTDARPEHGEAKTSPRGLPCAAMERDLLDPGSMGRTARKSSITFGLAQLPVEPRRDAERGAPSFAVAEQRKWSLVGYQGVDEQPGEPMPYDLVVKRRGRSKGEDIVATGMDFGRAKVEATQSIDIRRLVPSEALPASFVGRALYVRQMVGSRHAVGDRDLSEEASL
jgi:non-homologous end joining protein Ku